MKTKNIDVVRAGLARYERALSLALSWQRTRIHAKVAVLRADLRDRELGLTFEAERTPGLALAVQVAALR